ncbi:MAG: aroA [Acidimicrobiales bacterium]|nr:aroA [Acidimicrobiales bacterium]
MPDDRDERADLVDLAGLPDPLPIEPINGPLDATVRLPGSKSITNRALVCAALADGTSSLDGALFADDTEAMIGVLRAVGIAVRRDPREARLEIDGCGGVPPAADAEVDVRQSGTTARFVAPLLALGTGRYRVTGHPQLLARPMGPTFDALRSLGVPVEELAGPGHLPVTIGGAGRGSLGGVLRVPGDVSSQFLSGLLLAAPCAPGGLVIELTTELVSRPYVDLTVAVMRAFGATVDTPDPATFAVAAGGYRSVRGYRIEPDASAASYPLAAAAICGGRVRVEGLGSDSLQGDAGFGDLLAAMGATVHRDAHSTEVVGDGHLQGGDFDLTHLSDTAQTLAVCAAFAEGPVRVRGIGFIRRKEIDRVAAVATELRRCGIDAVEEPDGWLIHGGPVRPAVVQTSEDHRMAMSFALLGLRAPGIAIADPSCVAKTFPGYWRLLDQLRP